MEGLEDTLSFYRSHIDATIAMLQSTELGQLQRLRSRICNEMAGALARAADFAGIGAIGSCDAMIGLYCEYKHCYADIVSKMSDEQKQKDLRGW